MKAFEIKCLRKHLRISHVRQKTNLVQGKINFLVSSQEPLLVTIKRRKLAWIGHVKRHDSLSKTILQDSL